jgi:peptidoglycan/xylan/chitin deacetylase (PgdA/CDA1 family)
MELSKWPNGAKCALTFTFHFDAETLWTSRDPRNAKKPGMLSQGVFGAKVGVPLILQFLQQERLRTTFFVPGVVAERYPDLVRQMVAEGHEIGHHGYLHEWVDPDDPAGEEAVLVRGLQALESVAGVKPVGYNAPAWETSPVTFQLLEKYGFTYSCNMMDHIEPYFHPGSGTPGVVELPIHWLLDDAPFALTSVASPRALFPASHIMEVWLEEFRGIYEHGGLVNITMHPQVSGRPGKLQMLRRFFAEVRSYPDVWIATCEEVAQWWRSQNGEGTR